ncbi:MAG: hypothetical protein NVS9B14_08950 [Candidatus Acidiferrum sp.]
MKSISLFRIGVFATGLASLSAGAFPAIIPPNPQSQSVAALNKAASRKISAVANDGFSLDVKAGDTSSTLQFVTDAKTKVTGSISVGAMVNVEYRTDGDGRNVATAIVVQSNG